MNRDHFYWYGITFILAWISNDLSSEVWDETTYPFPDVHCGSLEMDQ